MARQDEILKSFLQHEMLVEKYQIKTSDLPSTVREALNSPIPIVSVIAQIVEALESSPPTIDKTLRATIIQYLNNNAV